jgi:hypothetical protein
MRQEMLMVVSLKLRLQRSKPEYFTPDSISKGRLLVSSSFEVFPRHRSSGCGRGKKDHPLCKVRRLKVITFNFQPANLQPVFGCA